jgi:hypothetical protein
MRPRLCYLLFMVLPLSSAVTSAEPTDKMPSRLFVTVQGIRALNGDGSGWGVGGSIRHAVSNSLRLWTGVEHVRLAKDGSSFVSTMTPWTFGMEVGPRTAHRFEPFFRLGFGMYVVQRRGEYVNFFTGMPAEYSDSGVFSGLNLGCGGRARLGGRAVLELNATLHQSLSGDVVLDAPSLGGAQMANLRVGLGYPLR